MKPENHRRAYNRMHACLHLNSADTRGMSEHTLRDIIEILEDCQCDICTPIMRGFMTTLELRDMGYHDAASIALTNACGNIGMLLITQNFVQN